MHVSHVTAQSVLIRCQLPAQRACDGHLIVAIGVLSQAALVGKPGGTDATLYFRLDFTNVDALIVHDQLGSALERIRA